MDEDLVSSVWHKFVGVYKKSQRCISVWCFVLTNGGEINLKDQVMIGPRYMVSETWRDGERIWKDIKDEERSRVLRLFLQMDLKEKIMTSQGHRGRGVKSEKEFRRP